MQLTIIDQSTDSGNISTVEVPESATVNQLKSKVKSALNLPHTRYLLMHNENFLQSGDKSLKDSGVANDDMIIVLEDEAPAPLGSTNPAPQQTNQASSAFPPQLDVDAAVESVRQGALLNPAVRESMKSLNPQLHSLLDHPDQFRQAYLQFVQQHQAAFGGSQSARDDEMRRLQSDPDNPANQARIMELIQEERINENLQFAADTSPEAFVPVSMLYIKLKIKGHDIYALVDSGAGHTIITPQVAEDCGLSSLIDKRYITEARGVGTQMSKGRIHSAPVSIGDTNVELPCSFTVLDCSVQCLFGLDMLKRHKCSIDLGKNALLIGDIETKFLTELEIEKYVKPFEQHW